MQAVYRKYWHYASIFIDYWHMPVYNRPMNAACRKHGRAASGVQRYRCPTCQKTFCGPRKAIGGMHLPWEKARMVAHLLVEGNSIRSTERITGVHHTTILALLERLGEGCTELLRRRVRSVAVSDLQFDEIWTFVRKKQARLKPKEKSRRDIGDAYCFIALERHTKLVLAWHLGKRDEPNTADFVTKVRPIAALKHKSLTF